MTTRIWASVFAAMAVLALSAPANAKTDPLSTHKEAWAGYGDAGYVGKPRNKGFKSAVKASGYGTKKKYATKSGKKYAALKYSSNDASPYTAKPKKKITGYSGGGVRWAASSACLNGSLKSLVASVAANYGAVTVSSTCRSRGHNAKVGGAKKSHHLTGDAVDFRVHGNWRSAAAYIRSYGGVGGFKHYGGGLFHADTGPSRSW